MRHGPVRRLFSISAVASLRLRSVWAGLVVLLAAVLVAFGATVGLPGTSVTPAQADTPTSVWDVPGALYELPLKLSDSNISSTLTDFPVKVVLTPQNFNYAEASSDGTAADASASDLAFVMNGDSSDAQLPYQVDTWNPGGTSVIWVQVPSFTGSSEEVDLYFGGSGGTGVYDGPDTTGVWSNGYTGVNQFSPTAATYPSGDAPSLDLNDFATSLPAGPSADPSAGGDGIPTGTTFPDLLSGEPATVQNNGATTGDYESTPILDSNGNQGIELSDVTDSSTYGGQYLTIPGSEIQPSSAGDITVTENLYVPADALNANDYFYELTQEPGYPDSGDTGDVYLAIWGGQLTAYLYPDQTTTSTGVGITQSGSMSAGWNQIAITVNGTAATLYLNGQNVGTATLPNALQQNPTGLIYIGEHPGGGASSDTPASGFGLGDVTFSDAARSSDWIQASYESETNNLISYGTIVSAVQPTGVTIDGSGTSATGTSTSATISWNAIPGGGSATYDVYEGTSSGGESSTPIATGLSGTSYTATGLDTSGQTYYFTVASVTSSGTSSQSAEVSYTYVSLAAPGQPTVTPYYSGTSMEVSWPAVSGAASYSVFEGTSSGGESSTPVACYALSATSCVVRGLSESTTYYFTVEATADGTSSAASPEASAETAASNTSGEHWQIMAAPDRLALTASDTNIDNGSLADFPAKVVLTPQNFDYSADSDDTDGSDLAFVQADDPNATQLPYEVDTWNPGGTSILYVMLPVLPFVQSENLELYYGSAASGTYDGPDAPAVWSNGFTSVNQFTASTATFPSGDAPTLSWGSLPTAPASPAADPSAGGQGLPTGTAFPDLLTGSAGGATLANVGATTGDYEANEVQGLDGGQAVENSGATAPYSSADDTQAGEGGTYLTMPASDMQTAPDGSFTLTTTVYIPASAFPNTEGGGDNVIIADQPDIPNTGDTGAFMLRLDAGQLKAILYPADGSGDVVVPGGIYPSAGWNAVAITVNGTAITLYDNGQAIGTGTLPDTVAQDPTALFYLGEFPGPEGNEGDPTPAFGYNNVTLSDTARDSDWIQATYQSEINQIFAYGTSQTQDTPQQVTATGTGTDSATVSWQSPLSTSGITGYEVFTGTSSGGESTTPVATVGASATSAQITDLPSGTTYVTVEAETSSGTSLPSNEATYTWLAAPTGVTATDFSDSSVELNWTSPNGAASYSVYEGSASGKESSTPTSCTELTPTSCVVSGLNYGQSYYFTVTAGDGSGSVTSAPSSEVVGEPGLETPWEVPAASERLPIILNNLSISSAETDQPVEVQLPASFDYTDASQNNLEFTLAGSSTALPYTVTDWDDSSTGESTIWVQLPTLTADSPSLYMYYNGVAAQTQSTVTASGPEATVGSTEYDLTTTGALIDGTPDIGDTLTADTSGFSPAAGSYSYQWFDGGQAITGATSSTLTLTPAMLSAGTINIGDKITVQITGTQGDVTLAPTSAPVTVALGEFTPGTVTVSGSAAVGGTLTADPGTWSPAGGTVAYQWLANGQPISGATSATYSPTADQYDSQLTVQVTESTSGYANDTAASAPVTVGAGTVSTTTEPTIAGTIQVGETVTASPGTWTAPGEDPSTGDGTPSYQWLLNGQPIAGATSSTYQIAPADAGQDLSVAVAVQPFGFSLATVDSASYEVEPGVFTVGTPSITGADATGSTLTAQTGAWSPQPTTLGYQWMLNGRAISGATSSTYTVPLADSGQQISVVVYGSATGMTTTYAASTGVTIADAEMRTATPPAIIGTAQVNDIVTAAAGSWNPTPSSFSYQWLLNGRPISGATSVTYTISSADQGGSLSVQVTVTAPNFAVTSVDSAAETVAAAASGTVVKSIGKPVITGRARVGTKLTVTSGKWAIKPKRVLYQWLLNGKKIKHATRATFKPTATDAGEKISVRITVEWSGHPSQSVTTKAVRVAKARKKPRLARRGSDHL